MKSGPKLILAAMLSVLAFTACQKREEPTKTPEPKAEAPAEDASGPGKTTNFENPPPAEPAKPAG